MLSKSCRQPRQKEKQEDRESYINNHTYNINKGIFTVASTAQNWPKASFRISPLPLLWISILVSGISLGGCSSPKTSSTSSLGDWVRSNVNHFLNNLRIAGDPAIDSFVLEAYESGTLCASEDSVTVSSLSFGIYESLTEFLGSILA